jgi:hypothetical protein
MLAQASKALKPTTLDKLILTPKTRLNDFTIRFAAGMRRYSSFGGGP